MSDTDALLRAKFAELCGQRDAILAVTAPKREARDKHVAKARTKEDELTAELRELEAPLYEINNEIGKISRALRPVGEIVSKTGE